MIALLGASAITLAALQASINAPTDAFRGCLRESSAKAEQEKIAADSIETYLRNACTVQMGSLKNAVVAFRTKNGMTKKAAAEDADICLRLWLKLKPRLASEGATRVYEMVDRDLVATVGRMERRGIKVDRDYLAKLSGTFSTEIAKLEERIYDAADGRPRRAPRASASAGR